LAAERVQCGVVQARREHAAGDGFGVDIREILRRDGVDQVFLEGLVLRRQFGLQVRILAQGVAQHVLDLVGLARHPQGQFLGRGDGLGALDDEIAQQVFKRAVFWSGLG